MFNICIYCLYSVYVYVCVCAYGHRGAGIVEVREQCLGMLLSYYVCSAAWTLVIGFGSRNSYWQSHLASSGVYLCKYVHFTYFIFIILFNSQEFYWKLMIYNLTIEFSMITVHKMYIESWLYFWGLSASLCIIVCDNCSHILPAFADASDLKWYSVWCMVWTVMFHNGNR